jgi:hypothetical protein
MWRGSLSLWVIANCLPCHSPMHRCMIASLPVPFSQQLASLNLAKACVGSDRLKSLFYILPVYYQPHAVFFELSS